MNQMLSSSFFNDNRANFATLVGDGPPIVMIAHGLMQRSNDTEYNFEQDRNFFYLSGLDEPDWIMVIDGDEVYLIEPEISDVEKVFNGAPDYDQVRHATGIETIYSNKEGWKKLKTLEEIRTTQPVNEKIGSIYTNPSKRVFLDRLNTKIVDISAELFHMRTIKRQPEIDAIRRAIELTGESFSTAGRELVNVKTEAELEAIFSSHFTANGARHGYEPIVAGGKNACTLHYTANNQKLPKNGLALIDIGAQYDYYSADITRTLALGKPTERQNEVYEAVRRAFEEILKEIKPGVKLDQYQKITSSVMLESIRSLKLGDDQNAMNEYFPHAASHGLGLDVHDAMVGYDSFQPGMVITLEPGIYIPGEGIGVRHEDDLLITETGVENLSKAINP